MIFLFVWLFVFSLKDLKMTSLFAVAVLFPPGFWMSGEEDLLNTDGGGSALRYALVFIFVWLLFICKWFKSDVSQPLDSSNSNLEDVRTWLCSFKNEFLILSPQHYFWIQPGMNSCSLNAKAVPSVYFVSTSFNDCCYSVGGWEAW